MAGHGYNIVTGVSATDSDAISIERQRPTFPCSTAPVFGGLSITEGILPPHNTQNNYTLKLPVGALNTSLIQSHNISLTSRVWLSDGQQTLPSYYLQSSPSVNITSTATVAASPLTLLSQSVSAGAVGVSVSYPQQTGISTDKARVTVSYQAQAGQASSVIGQAALELHSPKRLVSGTCGFHLL